MSLVGDYEKHPRPVRFTALFYGVAMGAIALAVFAFFMPVEWSEGKLRYRLWQAGARPLLWEKHRGFTQDRCGAKAPADCTCVWFLHGMGDSVTTWKNVFLDPAAFGGAPVRVFAIDLPGHGGSIRRHDLAEYRASNMAREIDAEIGNTAKCTRNAAVGNSFGGWIAALLALESPKRYEHLVLIGPGGLLSAEAETAGLLRDGSVESLKEFQKRAYFKPRVLTDSEWTAAARRVAATGTGEIEGAQVPADRLDGKLGKISVPTTIVWGEADRIIPRAVVDEFASGIPHAKLLTIPECGHLPQKECPAKLFPLLQRALGAN
jgi:pimeloyl-ACP methyl ester carboxylesterase